MPISTSGGGDAAIRATFEDWRRRVDSVLPGAQLEIEHDWGVAYVRSTCHVAGGMAGILHNGGSTDAAPESGGRLAGSGYGVRS